MSTKTQEQGLARSELSWRPFRREDAPALTELMAAAEAVDQTDENLDEEDVVEHYMSGLIDLEADTRLIWDGPTLIGCGEVFGQVRVREVHSVWLGGTIHPDLRRRGLGRRLLRWQLTRAQELHGERHPGVAANVMCGVADTNPGLAALARSEGLEEIRFWFDMMRPLDSPDQPLPLVSTVEGVRIRPYDAACDEDVRQAHNAAFVGHFGSTERDPTEWHGFFTGSRAFRPEQSLLAVQDQPGAHIAGYLLAYVFEADVAAKGRREIYIGQIGTLPTFRGRGVGSALMAAGLATWAAAGHEEVYLGVDAANATGALGLYERAGFTVHKRSTSWGLRLPARP